MSSSVYNLLKRLNLLLRNFLSQNSEAQKPLFKLNYLSYLLRTNCLVNFDTYSKFIKSCELFK